MTTADLKNDQLPNNRLEIFKSNITKVDDNFFNCPLTLSNGETINIPIRNDGYINATLLCTAGGKLFSNWYQNKQTKQLIKSLESDKENSNFSKSKEILNAGIFFFIPFKTAFGYSKIFFILDKLFLRPLSDKLYISANFVIFSP